MAEQVTTYQCPACTGPLHFDGKIGKLKCDYCGSTFTVEEVEKLFAAKNAAAAQAKQETDAKAQAAQASAQGSPGAAGASSAGASGTGPAGTAASAQAGPAASGWGADAARMRAYNCSSCGAELICDETTAATSCPYCGNNTIIPG